MVVLSAGSLVSDCCHVLAMCGDASCSFFQCSLCNQICRAAESLGEYHDRLEAPKRERQLLEREVIERVRFWRKAQGDAEHVTEVDGMRLTVVRAWLGLRKAADALNKFEAENKVG